jgi:hypothetical protein
VKVVPGCAANPWLNQSAVSVQPQLAHALAAVETPAIADAIAPSSAALLTRFIDDDPHCPRMRAKLN